jgi:hypothetical protein
MASNIVKIGLSIKRHISYPTVRSRGGNSTKYNENEQSWSVHAARLPASGPCMYHVFYNLTNYNNLARAHTDALISSISLVRSFLTTQSINSYHYYFFTWYNSNSTASQDS